MRKRGLMPIRVVRGESRFKKLSDFRGRPGAVNFRHRRWRLGAQPPPLWAAALRNEPTRCQRRADDVDAHGRCLMDSKPASERHVRLRGGDAETTILAEAIHNAVVAVEALATLWEEAAREIGSDGRQARGDAIMDAFMRFGGARQQIINWLNRALYDAEGGKWHHEVVDALETVIVELNAPDATMTSLATELARADRLRRVADHLNRARRDLAYGHVLAQSESARRVVRVAGVPLVGYEIKADEAIRAGCKTLKEISRRTGISVDTLKNHVIRALKRKRGLLSKPYRYPESM